MNTGRAQTVIQELGKLGNNQVYVKRDDLIPFSFGGNKARKAYYFFEKMNRGDFNCVVTYGSSSSNHCRVIANIAAAQKMPCYIISPSQASKPTFNSKMVDFFGAKRTFVPVKDVHSTIESKLHSLCKAGMKPFFIPGGGHGNLGTQAYVDCYKEIKSYEKENGTHFDYIFHASGTGTTQAGLICGQLMHGDRRKIVGISIARKNPRGRNIVLDSLQDYLHENNIPIDENTVQAATIFEDKYTEDGYGKKNTKIELTILEILTRYGIPLDATYTGKAFWGMQQYLEANNISGKNILFIHTGGTPLFFDSLKSTGEIE